MSEVPLDAMVDLVSRMVEKSEADGSITREESGGTEEFFPIYESDPGSAHVFKKRGRNSASKSGAGSGG